ncbi:hypothetical protein EDD21DRAFT_425721 [Dissophora ornata]|nr:hypothetical protein EDD21DRAFT_425721 [Dissophora ornata]
MTKEISPLDLPEILLLLSEYLAEDPQSLASCTRVCRSWHNSLNPFLWRSLSASKLLSKGQLSGEAFNKNAQYIRHLQVGKLGREQYPVQHCTNLRTLLLEDDRKSEWDYIGISNQHLISQAGSVGGGRNGMKCGDIKDDWRDHVVELILQNPGLQKVTVMMERFEPTVEFWSAIQASGGQGVKELECVFIRIPQGQMESLLDAFTHIDTLVLQHCTFDIFPLEILDGRRYPCLKSLKLATNTCLDLTAQIQLMRCFPELKSLSWSIMGPQSLPVQDFCDLLSNDCPQIESIVLSDRNLESDHLARILHAIPRLTRFALRFDTSSSMFNDPEVLRATKRHFATLKDLEFGQVRSNIRAAVVLEILKSCPDMQRLVIYGRLDCSPGGIHAPGIDETDLENTAVDIPTEPTMTDGSEEQDASWDDTPWACLGLKRLHMIMGADSQSAWCRHSLQQQLFLQLGRLTELQTLSLGHCILWMYENAYTHQGLDFTIEAGLSKLAGLQKLEELNIEGIYQHMGEQDLEWMLGHWPKLRLLEGSLHHKRENLARLDAIMQERGFKVSNNTYRKLL